MGRARGVAVALIVGSFVMLPTVGTAGGKADPPGHDKLSKIDHIVVIYEENHSFDNLYGGWEGVNGVDNAQPSNTTQISQSGAPYECLLQNDVNLTSPPLTPTCPATTPTSAFANKPFTIDDFIASGDKTC